METDKFIAVLTFTYPYEVAIIRSRLEEQQIRFFYYRMVIQRMMINFTEILNLVCEKIRHDKR